jgi:hypothetical protein
MNATSLAFSPLVPWWLIIAAGVVALAIVGLQLYTRQKGVWLRACAFGLMCLALSNPSLVNEQRDRLKDIVLLAVDRTGSQGLADRRAQTDQAFNALRAELTARPNTELRTIEVLERPDGADGTKLFEAITNGMADLPPDRIAGIVAITDGQVHDVPANYTDLGVSAPFHALITGQPNERDRRIEIVRAPRFGIVGKEQEITFRVVDDGSDPVRYTLRREGQVIGEDRAIPGQDQTVSVSIDRAGQNLFEIDVEAIPDELTAVNNIAVVPVSGIRDKMRVLLVSGAPHAGERTWRNLLKADANVELVHFTILRPPEKQDGTPINELSLIAFPTRELFQEKINEFNLIIFDRYANQSTILPNLYFDNIVQYVRDGGAVLLSAGPEFGQPGGIQESPLSTILPVTSDGSMRTEAFLPRVTGMGEKHPVTRGLPGSQGEQPSWAPWFRMIKSTAIDGTTVMSDDENNPLLVLSRVEKGRVGIFLSDQFWLWARGFQQGGPYLDMLRRLSHWLLKEPDLEEEALNITADGRNLVVERRTLLDEVPEATLTGPDGEAIPITLSAAGPGTFRAALTARRSGLHKVTQGDLVAFVSVGPPNPREFREVVSTERLLQPIADASGGQVVRLANGSGIAIPRLVDIRNGTSFGGSGYIGLKPTEASTLRGIGLFALTTGLIGLVLLLLASLAAWLGEGRGFRRRNA